MLLRLMQNSKALPKDLFDWRDEMHKDVESHIKKAVSFVRKKFFSYLKDPISDIVCYGNVCSGLNHSKSIIRIGLVTNPALSEKALQNTCFSIIRRGFRFRVYRHVMIFSILKSVNEIGANWSVMRHKWNVKPVFKDCEFGLEELYQSYQDLNDDFHRVLDPLEKNSAGFYTPQSCEIIRQYFDQKEQKIKKLIPNNPAYIYSLEFGLFSALDLFGVRKHFTKEIVKSECYYLNGETDENI